MAYRDNQQATDKQRALYMYIYKQQRANESDIIEG